MQKKEKQKQKLKRKSNKQAKVKLFSFLCWFYFEKKNSIPFGN